ncbi:hypothetical protein NC652_035562 [Populus alba x Populus x berolinensis]|nr:hypothetical protein NC652_035562 [Populus alba x Populus x berolinensis]
MSKCSSFVLSSSAAELIGILLGIQKPAPKTFRCLVHLLEKKLVIEFYLYRIFSFFSTNLFIPIGPLYNEGQNKCLH